jgi:hypothetical protein
LLDMRISQSNPTWTPSVQRSRDGFLLVPQREAVLVTAVSPHQQI